MTSMPSSESVEVMEERRSLRGDCLKTPAVRVYIMGEKKKYVYH